MRKANQWWAKGKRLKNSTLLVSQPYQANPAPRLLYISGCFTKEKEKPVMGKQQVKDYLEKIDTFRSMKLGGIYPRALQEKLLDTVVRHLSCWCLGELSED